MPTQAPLRIATGYNAVLIVTNKYLERMLLLLYSVYGGGLKHPVRESILCPCDVFGNFEIINI